MSNAQAPTLEVRDLQTYFFTKGGIARAVDGVSFTVERGKVLGLVGESGSGKTVTGFSVLGLVDEPGRVVGGEILYHGENLVTASPDRMRALRGANIAMIFQDPMMTLNPVLRIDTQMIEAIQAHEQVSDDDARQRARDALGQVGIPSPDERLRSYPHQFSGGMRQRVAIAIALLNKPDLIVADEPTTALDVTIQAQILELMKNLTRDLGVAMIIITHNLGVVARYADRVNVMYAGKIIESGSASDIYYRPHHPYTLALLKSVPRMDQPRQAKLDPVEGQPPDLTMLDDGCAFRPRCRFATEQCASSYPSLDEIADGHTVACFQKDQVAATMKEAS